MQTETEAAEVKAQQRREWDLSSARWRRRGEQIMRTSAPVGEVLVRLVEAEPGNRYLDVASGTGEPALSLAVAVGPSGRVVATDQSAGMLAVACERAPEAGRHNISFVLADAEQLAFRDASFDGLTCRFGVMFCPRPLAVLQEMRRALRRGGRAALAVWTSAEKNPFSAIGPRALRPYLKDPPPEPRPGVPGPLSWGRSGTTERLLQEAGFRDIATELVTVTFAYDSPEDYVQNWREQVERQLAQIVADRTEAEAVRIRADVEAAVRSNVRPYIQNGRVAIPGEALCAVARA